MNKLKQKILNVFLLDKKLGSQFNYLLFMLTCIICTIGIIAIYSASNINKDTIFYGYIIKQAIWYAIGLFVIIPISLIFSYKTLEDFAFYIYIFIIILLLCVTFWGQFAGGSKRWISLGFFALQPSEFSKIAIIIVLAKILSQELDNDGLGYKNLIKPFLITVLPAFLILKQPDLGTALLICIITASIAFFAKINKKTLISLSTAGIFLVPLLWLTLKNYQKKRILSFIYPNSDPFGSSYHLIQSKIAIGSGMLTGKGFLQGSQKSLSFLPEQHTDFIWSVIAEEIGFIGTTSILFCFILLFAVGLNISYNCKDNFGTLLAFGINAMLFWQFFINVSMVMGLLPIVGIALPFLSYGGSSAITNLIGIAILLNISMRRFS